MARLDDQTREALTEQAAALRDEGRSFEEIALTLAPLVPHPPSSVTLRKWVAQREPSLVELRTHILRRRAEQRREFWREQLRRCPVRVPRNRQFDIGCAIAEILEGRSLR
jgi:hypothetical protein